MRTQLGMFSSRDNDKAVKQSKFCQDQQIPTYHVVKVDPNQALVSLYLVLHTSVVFSNSCLFLCHQ